jgi:hypothetical protein
MDFVGLEEPIPFFGFVPVVAVVVALEIVDSPGFIAGSFIAEILDVAVDNVAGAFPEFDVNEEWVGF